jgi:hypothetical protein
MKMGGGATAAPLKSKVKRKKEKVGADCLLFTFPRLPSQWR